MLNKVAINLNTNVVYGIGKTQEEALKEAYLFEFMDRIDQNLDYINIDEFKELNSDLQFLEITKHAHNLLMLYRPPYVLNDSTVCIRGKKIMSMAEAIKADEAHERSKKRARERYRRKKM